MADGELQNLLDRAERLEQENARLQALLDKERGKGEAALAHQEERYRTLFESIDEGFCIIEFFDGPHGPLSDYVHVEANPAYTRHAGIPNVVGQKVREMVPAEADGWVELYRGVLVSGKPIRFERELIATGRHLELAAFRVEPASRKQVAVLFQDMTARRRAEQALRQLNETLEARVDTALAERKLLADLVEGANAFVQVIDRDFRLVAVNGAAARELERLFGVRPHIGSELLALIGDDNERLKQLWTKALSGREFVETLQLGRADGYQRHYEIHFSTLRDAGGAQIGAYQFAYDVTERLREHERLRSTEDALRQAQKMEAVGQLTGGIAHDFNNMLAVIMSSLRLTQRRLERGDRDVNQFIDGAMQGAERAANLVSRLLSFSRQQPLSPQRSDANRLVSGMEDVLRRTLPEDIRIEFVQAGGLWNIHIDQHGLESAVLNLAVNARDAMPDGGKLTVETANAHLDDSYAAAHAEVPAGQYVMVAITDTGHGMTPEVLAKVFEPFFTTKAVGVGTGLGLSQVYGFVRQSGGHVKVYSEPGLGTTVKLYFPRLAGGQSSNPAIRTSAGRSLPLGSGQLVLLVEDEQEVRRLTGSMLEELGYSALSTGDPLHALDLLGQNPAIELLMTDVVMPGMNGRKLADEAARSRPDLPVLFSTGYTRNAIVHNGTLDEGVELIMKPYTLEGLAEKLTKLLANRRAS